MNQNYYLMHESNVKFNRVPPKVAPKDLKNPNLKDFQRVKVASTPRTQIKQDSNNSSILLPKQRVFHTGNFDQTSSLKAASISAKNYTIVANEPYENKDTFKHILPVKDQLNISSLQKTPISEKTACQKTQDTSRSRSSQTNTSKTFVQVISSKQPLNQTVLDKNIHISKTRGAAKVVSGDPDTKLLKKSKSRKLPPAKQVKNEEVSDYLKFGSQAKIDADAEQIGLEQLPKKQNSRLKKKKKLEKSAIMEIQKKPELVEQKSILMDNTVNFIYNVEERKENVFSSSTNCESASSIHDTFNPTQVQLFTLKQNVHGLHDVQTSKSLKAEFLNKNACNLISENSSNHSKIPHATFNKSKKNENDFLIRKFLMNSADIEIEKGISFSDEKQKPNNCSFYENPSSSTFGHKLAIQSGVSSSDTNAIKMNFESVEFLNSGSSGAGFNCNLVDENKSSAFYQQIEDSASNVNKLKKSHEHNSALTNSQAFSCSHEQPKQILVTDSSKNLGSCHNFEELHNAISFEQLGNLSRYFVRANTSNKNPYRSSRNFIMQDTKIKTPVNLEKLKCKPQRFLPEEVVVLSVENPLIKLLNHESNDVVHSDFTNNQKAEFAKDFNNTSKVNFTQISSSSDSLYKEQHNWKSMCGHSECREQLQCAFAENHFSGINVCRPHIAEQSATNMNESRLQSNEQFENNYIKTSSNTYQENPLPKSKTYNISLEENLQDNANLKPCSCSSTTNKIVSASTSKDVNCLNSSSTPFYTHYTLMSSDKLASQSMLSSVSSTPRTPDLKPETIKVNNVLGQFSPVPQKRLFPELDVRKEIKQPTYRSDVQVDIGKYKLLSHAALEEIHNVTNVYADTKNLIFRLETTAKTNQPLSRLKQHSLSQASTEDSLKRSDYFKKRLLKQTSENETVKFDSIKNTYFKKKHSISESPERSGLIDSTSISVGNLAPNSKVTTNLNKLNETNKNWLQNSYLFLGNEENQSSQRSQEHLDSFESKVLSQNKNEIKGKSPSSTASIITNKSNTEQMMTTDPFNALHHQKENKNFFGTFKTEVLFQQPLLTNNIQTQPENKHEIELDDEEQELKTNENLRSTSNLERGFLSDRTSLPKLNRHQFETLLRNYLSNTSSDSILNNIALPDADAKLTTKQCNFETSSDSKIFREFICSEDDSNVTKVLLQKVIDKVSCDHKLRENALVASKNILLQEFVCNILLKKHANDLYNYYEILLNDIFSFCFNSLNKEAPTYESVKSIINNLDSNETELSKLNLAVFQLLRLLVHEATRTDETFYKELRKLLTTLEIFFS